jgi:hypothetical protein
VAIKAQAMEYGTLILAETYREENGRCRMFDGGLGTLLIKQGVCE